MRPLAGILVVLALFIPALLASVAHADVVDPGEDTFTPDIGLQLTLSINGTSLSEGTVAALPEATSLPVSFSATPKPEGSVWWDPFDGTENSQLYWSAFYLDFYEGTPFSNAIFISGEQVNAENPIPKPNSTISFLHAGNYFAVIYDSGQIRDYDVLCTLPNTCYPPSATLEDVRSAIELGPGPGRPPPAGFLGIVSFTVEEAVSTSPSVLFLPGIKGSVLKIAEDTLWPPTIWSDDLLELALTTDGESINPVVVDGLLETFYGTPIYSGFSSFMDNLVTNETVAEWEPLPYDWRFSPEKILENGIETPGGTIDPVAEVERLAALSGSGKVVIVAHSMGGLLGKALIKRLEEEGKEGLIESFIMVGTPQLGTPQAAAALLHGDDMGILGNFFLVNQAASRSVAQNFQSAYDLLPSPRYFDEVSDAVFVFDPDVSFTQEWLDFWGEAISTYADFFAFITGDGVERADPDPSITRIPEILRADLAGNARDFHETYDSYVFPESIRVVQIAGWGVPTTKGISYRNRHFVQSYEPIQTLEGDKTVVYSSAVSSVADEIYFFNLKDYRTNLDNSAQHRNLLSKSSIQDVLKSVISEETVIETQYISTVKPSVLDTDDQLIVSAHSPVILGAYDQGGNFTGIDPSQDLGADVLTITEDIQGSTFLTFGDSQYLFLPKEGSYSVAFQGTGSGPATVDIENFTNDTAIPIVSYSDIPVATGTSATFLIDSAAPQNTEIEVDSNGDGDTDLIAVPDGTELPINQLLTLLKEKINALDAKKSLKQNLLKKVQKLEKKIAKQKDKQVSRVLLNLTKQVTKKGEKGKLSNADVAEILQLLEQLESAL